MDMENKKIKQLLGLNDDVIIKEIKTIENHIEIYLETEKKEQICPSCNKKVTRLSSYSTNRIKDVNYFDKEVFLIIRKRRLKCNCGKTFYENIEFLKKYQRMTTRMFASIYNKLSKEYSFSAIGKDLGISTNTVIRAFDKIKYPKAKFDNLEVLSIDEFKGNTGGEKYNCILANPKNKIVLDILPTRKTEYLSRYFRSIKKDNKKRIEYFVSDMWKPYKEVSDVWFKNSKFVVDKYHWIRQVIWAFERIRKDEQKKFYKMFRIYFKKSKRLLTKRFEFLSEEDKQAVNIMLYKSDNIRVAHTLKEEFLKILDCQNREEAKKRLSEWTLYAQNSKLVAFEKCANTMIKWSSGILNSFDTPYTNGFIEGCNNKIKVLKRNAYGYRNFERFRNRILHIFNYGKIKI